MKDKNSLSSLQFNNRVVMWSGHTTRRHALAEKKPVRFRKKAKEKIRK